MSNLPWPIPDADTREYWDAITNETFTVQQCLECSTFQYYPRAICTTCSSTNLKMMPSSGTGTLYSYTVSRRAAHPIMADRVPYAVGLIDLDEGPRMLANIVTDDPESLTIGASMSIAFLKVDEGMRLPAFTPTAESS